MRYKKIRKILYNLLAIAKSGKCEIYKTQLPAGIGAFCMFDNNKYKIILNAGKKTIWRALIHELLHIYNNDFRFSGRNVENIEKKTHKFAQFLTKNVKNDVKNELFSILAKSEII